MSGRRVVCAAIRGADGQIIVGIRHYSGDMLSQIMARSDGKLFYHRHGDDQGFVDQKGVYMTREEAWVVASEAGQILRFTDGKNGVLYSENLY